MFGIFKKFLYNPNQETIDIFERETKIEYDSELFLSLKVLSLTHSRLRNLLPLSVFTNVEILNLAHNRITNLEPLETMEKLRIIDFRFNQIRELPAWVYALNKPLYWSRKDEDKEGIYLEGNPLNKDLISKIKENSQASMSQKDLPLQLSSKEVVSLTIEDLQPLNTQHLAIFLPQENDSQFVTESVLNNLWIETTETNLRINVSCLEYDKSDTLLNPKRQIFQQLPYILLVLKDRECCLHPHLLETLLTEYPSSKLFLIIEGRQSNIEEKINFFKTYSQSKNILEVFHSSDSQSNKKIKEKILSYIQTSQSVNSLWNKNWIALKEAIEKTGNQEMNFVEYQLLADGFLIPKEMREYLFKYLQKVGSIKEYKANLETSLVSL